MSEITDRIAAHFESLGTREITVPEWDATIYCQPVTIAERQRIYKDSKNDNDYETLVKILIVKARDKEGAAIFTIADRQTLLIKTDSAVLVRVASEIMRSDAPDSAELKA